MISEEENDVLVFGQQNFRQQGGRTRHYEAISCKEASAGSGTLRVVDKRAIPWLSNNGAPGGSQRPPTPYPPTEPAKSTHLSELLG